MKPWRYLIGLLWGALTAPTFSSETEIEVLLAPTTLFSESDAHGRPHGYAVDLIQGILQEANISGRLGLVPFARMVEMLQRGGPIVASAVVRTPERERDYYWITPVAVNTVSLFVNETLAKQKKMTMQTLSSVSVVRGDYREQMLRDYPHIDVMSVTSWDQAIQAVQRGRVEGVLFSQMGVIAYCQNFRLPCDDLRAAETLKKQYSYLVIPRTAENGALAARLTMAANVFKASEKGKQLASHFVDAFPSHIANVQVIDGIIDLSGVALEVDERSLWVLADYTPFFVTLGGDGQPRGYAYELVQKILTQANIPSPILITPRNRMIRELERRPNVLAFTVAHTDERDPHYHWITPITQNRFGLYGRGEPLKTLTDAGTEVSIAVLRDDFRTRIAQQWALNYVEFDDWATAIAAFYDGRITYLFATDSGIQEGCEQLKYACEDINRLYTHDYHTTHLVMSKQGTELALVERIRQAAAEVKQSEHYRAWGDRWIRAMANEHGRHWHLEQGVVNMWPATEKK